MMEAKQLDKWNVPTIGPESLLYVVIKDDEDYVQYGCAPYKGKFGIIGFMSEAEASLFRDKIDGTCHVKQLPLSNLVAAAMAKPEPCVCVHVWYEGVVMTWDCKPKGRPVWCN